MVHKKEECTDQADGEIHGVPGLGAWTCFNKTTLRKSKKV